MEHSRDWQWMLSQCRPLRLPLNWFLKFSQSGISGMETIAPNAALLQHDGRNDQDALTWSQLVSSGRLLAGCFAEDARRTLSFVMPGLLK